MNLSFNSTELRSLIPNNISSADIRRETSSFIIRLTISLLGTVGNLILLVAVARDRTTRSGTRVLIANIGMTSLILMAIGQPGVSAFLFVRESNGACSVFAFYTFFLTATSWAEVSLAINRVVAVSLPHQYDRLASIKTASIMTLTVWIIAAIVVALMSGGVGLRFQQIAPGSCLTLVTSGLGVFLTMAMNMIPVILAGLASLQILGTVVYSRCSVGGNADQMRPAVLRRKNTLNKRMVLAKAMMASFVWCFCCTVPLVITVNFLPKTVLLNPGWISAVRMLAITEYSVNPFIFLSFYQKYFVVLRRCISSCQLRSKVSGVPAGSSVPVVGSLLEVPQMELTLRSSKA